MMRHRLLATALMTGCAFLPDAARAQPATSSPFIIDRDRADRLKPPTPPVASTPVAAQADIAAIGDASVTISQVVFDNIQAPAPVADAARGFVGKPASRETLAALAAAMSEAYAKLDIALYTVSIPQQDFARGTVHVAVAEGFVENVVIDGDTKGRQLELIKHYVARMTKEQPLSRRKLERYLSLIRDTPGMTVEAQLLRGHRAGGVVLVLTVRFRKDRVNFSYDNRGSQLLGKGEFQATARLYRLFREGDETVINGAAATDFHRYRYIGITHSTPIGSDGLRLSLAGGYLTTRPRHSPLRGSAKTAGISLSYPLIRGYKRNLVGSIGIDGLNSDNAALGTLIVSERTRAVRLAAGYSYATPKRVWSVSGSVSRGLNILGARTTQPLSEREFTKLTARATFDQQIGKHFIVRTKLTGQYSNDRLPAAERLALGGAEFGRAFDNAILTGDRGYAGSAELAWRPDLGKRWTGTELYGFVDGGRVHLVRRDPLPAASYDLASAGAGVRLNFRETSSIELEAARSIDRPFPGNNDNWRISVAWNLDIH